MEPASFTSLETINTSDVTSDGSEPATIKKKQRMNGEKTCRVCGDRALAHNFDVISCESCKAFFRRNALKTKIRPCAFDGDCEITPNTRRFCAHCRLKKCLQSGMKSDMILDDREKKARQDKLSENRRKREAQAQQQQQQQEDTETKHHKQEQQEDQQQQMPTSSVNDATDISSTEPDSLLMSESLFESVLELESALMSMAESGSMPNAETRSMLRSESGSGSDLESGSVSRLESGSWSGSCLGDSSSMVDWVIPPPSTPSSVSRSLRGSAARSQFLERAKRQATLLDFSVLMPHEPHPLHHSSNVPGGSSSGDQHQQHQQQQEIDTSFQHVPTDQLPSDLHKYWRLQDDERSLLMELTIAYQETVLKLPEHMTGDGQGGGTAPSANNVQNILNRCQRFARDIVNFVKRVPDFRSLRMEDQVAALKGASWRTFLVKSSANFVVERNAWIKDNGYLSVEEFTEASPEHRDRILLLARYSAALKNILRNDPTTFAVLQMLVLFDPRDPNLSDRQQVARMADKYSLLLKRLLQSQWSYDFAGHYLSAVGTKVEEMGWVASSVQVMFRDWLHLLEPLMREVLNLS